jgi:hypothetical protein
MADRQELHALVQQVPPEKFEHVLPILEFAIDPPKPDPEMQKMHERTREFRTRVEKKFQETRRPGTGGGYGGGGSTMVKDGKG